MRMHVCVCVCVFIGRDEFRWVKGRFRVALDFLKKKEKYRVNIILY